MSWQSNKIVSILKSDVGMGLIRMVRVESPKHPEGNVVIRVTKKSFMDCVLFTKLELNAGVVPVLVSEIIPVMSLILQR